MLVTLFLASSITFFLIHAIPGDPLASLGRKLPEQIRANYYAKYGLDDPVVVQYGKFVKNLVQGDLGESLNYPGRSVNDTIVKHAPISGRVGGQALLLGVSIGIFLGIIAAFNRGKWPDYNTRNFSSHVCCSICIAICFHGKNDFITNYRLGRI